MYVPVCEGKWWSTPESGLGASSKTAATAVTAYSYTCRIMKTELEQQLLWDDRYDRCVEEILLRTLRTMAVTIDLRFYLYSVSNILGLLLSK